MHTSTEKQDRDFHSYNYKRRVTPITSSAHNSLETQVPPLMVNLSTNLLRANRPPLLSPPHILRVGLPPLAGLNTNIEPPLAHGVLEVRPHAREPAALLLALAAVQLGARLARAGVAPALMHVGARGTGEGGGGGRGLAGGGLREVVGAEGVLGGSGAGRSGLSVEFGDGVLADVDAGLVLLGGSRVSIDEGFDFEWWVVIDGNLRPCGLGARRRGGGSGIRPAGPWIRGSCWPTL